MVRSRASLVPGVIGAVLGVAVLVALVLLILRPSDTPAPSGPAAEDPAPSWAPPVELPPTAATPAPGLAGLADPGWLAETAAATAIPERVLAAYAGATIVKAETMPECGLSWTTLAGIGATESDHGRHGGSSVQADGAVLPPIFGVALDGAGTAEIPDSDNGAIDGDPDHDRAVGPMQLIPQTWRNWHVDANGDGVEDPHHIDDAVLAAANYLCRAATAQDTEEGWRAAVSSYNSAPSYLEAVARAAVAYSR